MPNRTRPIRIEFRVSDYEHRLIKNKMAQLGTHNMGAYLRKMAIDGYIIRIAMAGLVDPAADMVDVGGCSADGSG